MPEVSVVTIFKDEERFLPDAIESIHAQTFTAWELLLVDDGSTDRSSEIARFHAERSPNRIRYLEHEGHANRGMSASRNLGLAEAGGDLVAFLDADDVLLPSALEGQLAAFREHPRIGMAYGPLEYWFSWTGRPEDGGRDFVQPAGVPGGRVHEPPSLIPVFLRNDAYSPAGVMVRRALARRIGGFEASFRSLYEDQVFAAKICLAAPVYLSAASTYRYRQHPASSCMTAEREGTTKASRERFLRWLVGYLDEQGLAGCETWRLAGAELRLDRRFGGATWARRLAAAVRGRGA
jgi:glycosyltransferase involved in cell wall biosynthesis